jgi:hypothetical protein
METSVYRIAVRLGRRDALRPNTAYASFEEVPSSAQGSKDCTEQGFAM